MKVPFRLTPTGDGLRKLLGPLEAAIMPLLWHSGPATVKMIHRQLIQTHHDDIAYATVMTSMARLAKEGILSREQTMSTRGRAGRDVYAAVTTEATFIDHAITSVIQSLLRDYPAQARRALGVRHGHI
jgi:predicted transcriptional regulator